MAVACDRTLTSFDGTCSLSTTVARPDRFRALLDVLQKSPHFIPRGAGLSYCSAAAAANSTSVLSSQFNRIIDFNPKTMVVTVEPGLSLGELLDFALAHNLYPPVLAGHPAITVGGSIAFNVHGKSQFNAGNFESCVRRLWIFHPEHGEIECSPTKNAEVFFLTIGGCGLTGFIMRADIQLEALQGQALEVVRIPVANLLTAGATLQELRRDYQILYSWHNLNLLGDSFGQGVIYAERFIAESAADINHFNTADVLNTRRRLPVWNKVTIPIMCRLYGIKERLQRARSRVGLRRGSFPINGKEIYFTFFRGGFREYQFIVPFNRWQDVVAEVQGILRGHRIPVALGSLKIFSGEQHYLNFCMPGICLSIDVQNTPAADLLFDDLDQLLERHGGIPNLAKDSRLDGKTASRLFPEYGKFRDELRRFDPKLILQSELRQRLEL